MSGLTERRALARLTEGVLLCGERTDDDDGLAGLLLHDPLLDDDGRLQLVVLLPDRNGFAVVCA